MDVAFDQPEDFAADESFVHYCFRSHDADVLFWEKYLKDHPEKRLAAEKGKKLVFLMSISIREEEKHEAFSKLGISPYSGDEKRPEGRPENLVVSGRRRRRLKRRSYLIMGVLVLLAAGFWWNRSDYRNPGPVRGFGKMDADYVSVRGEKRQITLDDGTVIVLNALSRLVVDRSFGHHNREVTLIGEAFFHVAKDAVKPFIIHTDNMDITVLGTTLNVRDYPGDRKAETALLSGSVAVQLHSDSLRKIILKPDEKIITYQYDTGVPSLNAGKKVQVTAAGHKPGFDIAPLIMDPLSDSGTAATAWMDNKLVFRDESFEDLAEQMARKYDVQFHFSENTLKRYRFTGVFSKESVEEALQALQLTSPSDPFYFSVEGKEVYIQKK